jgi:hypothetical protein
MRLYNQLLTINSQVQTGDYPPTKQHGEMIADFMAKVTEQVGRMQVIESTDLAAFNGCCGAGIAGGVRDARKVNLIP